MNNAQITLSTEKPRDPEADLAFFVDYKKGVGSASRVFLGTHDFIKACERLDKELLQAIDSNIEAVMVLEDIEIGSLKTWLKNILTATDDQALKDMDWKPAVGKYLVRAKYAVLRWADTGGDIVELAHEIRKIASETDVKHLPDYRAPSPEALITAAKDFQALKDNFIEGDSISVISTEETYQIKISTRWNIEDIEALAVKEIIKFPPAPMILAVKKPDYLSESKWELRHGKRNIQAKIDDVQWLKSFQAREKDVRPGDSLKCEMQIEHLYGHDNELIAERYTVTRVLDILVNKYNEERLFDD